MTAGLPVRTLTHSKVAGHAARKQWRQGSTDYPQLQFAPHAEAREAPSSPRALWTARLDTIQVSWLTVRVTRAAFAQGRRRAARDSVSRLTFNLTLR